MTIKYKNIGAMSYEKYSNMIFPIGGISGGILNALPSINSLVSLVIGAVVGSVIAYFVKFGLDILLKRKQNEQGR